jgi:hypothetical protein
MKFLKSLFLIMAALTHSPSILRAAPPHPVLVLREGLDGPINEWTGPAKCALYDDGTVIMDTSNEMISSRAEPAYYKSTLPSGGVKRLIQSLSVPKLLKSSKTYGQGEGVSWRLIYWSGAQKRSVMIIGSLNAAPPGLRRLVGQLERFPNRDQQYINYDCEILFSNSSDAHAITWPSSWRKPPIPSSNYPFDIGQKFRIETDHALWLRRILRNAKTDSVVVDGRIRRVLIQITPRLPNDSLWVNDPT